MTSRHTLAGDLARARERTLRLVDFDDAELHRQYDPLMSPLVWDLAHIGQQEEFWLLRGGQLDRPGLLPPDVEGLYDAFVHSRASRVELPLLSPSDARAYCRTVRSAALDALDALPDDPDSRIGRVHVRHGRQPRESARRNHAAGTEPAHRRAAAAATPRCPRAGPGWRERRCWCPAARSCWAWTPPTNRTRWTTSVPRTWSTCRRSGSAGFRSPTVNGEHFVDDGGYRQPRWWSERGWEHRQQRRSDRAAVLER